MDALPALSKVQTPSTAERAQDAAATGSRFADAMDGAKADAGGPAVAAPHPAGPSGSAGSARSASSADRAVRTDPTDPTAPTGRTGRGSGARAAAPARRGSAKDAAAASAAGSAAGSAAAGQESVPSGAAPRPSATSTSDSPQWEVDPDQAAVPLPALTTTQGSGTGSGDSGDASVAAAAADAAAKSDRTGTSANDPIGLLAMIFGVAPTVYDATAGGGAVGATAGAAASTGAAATAGAPAAATAGATGAATAGAAVAGAAGSGAAAAPAAADPSATAGAQSAVSFGGSPLSTSALGTSALGTSALGTSALGLAAAMDTGTQKPDASSPADAPATAAPSAQALSDLVRGWVPAPGASSNIEQNIAPQVGSAGWPAAVAAQVHWLASSGVTGATLHLAPDHLGPVQVSIDLRSSEVNVSFTAAHADTRAALELALPKLREMFAAGGLSLGQATVQQEARSGSRSPASAPALRTVDSPGPASPPSTGQALGLVDEYA